MKLETLPAHAAVALALAPGPLFAQTTSDDPFPSADSTELGVSVETLDELWTTVSDWVEAGDPVGAEVLVIKEGRTIFHETFGWKDREREVPMEKHSIARIRSMTKPFVGTSILMLREKGELALDDPVSKYIPAWDTDVCRDIRIEQLLTHTAGFKQPGYPGSPMSFANLRDLVDATGAAGPQMTPGEQYNYSDADTATLGCIVAELSGMPVEDFIQKNFFDALGMTSSMCNLSTNDPRRPRVSSTYKASGAAFQRYWDNTRAQSVPYFRACGGIYSTPMDYARFLDMWVQGGVREGERFLPESVVRDALRVTPLSGSGGVGYGWHWQIPIVVGEASHDESESLPEFGHAGSDGTIAIAFPRERVMAFYFTQSRDGKTIGSFMRLITNRFNRFGEKR